MPKKISFSPSGGSAGAPEIISRPPHMLYNSGGMVGGLQSDRDLATSGKTKNMVTQRSEINELRVCIKHSPCAFHQ